MTEKPTVDEFKRRVQRDIDHFKGELPERVALCWAGYFGGLLEWGLITPAEHYELTQILPVIHDNPMVAIFLGRTEGPTDKNEQEY